VYISLKESLSTRSWIRLNDLSNGSGNQHLGQQWLILPLQFIGMDQLITVGTFDPYTNTPSFFEVWILDLLAYFMKKKAHRIIHVKN
jgi:hypothetical protein